jgi:hypothetical protein
MAQICAIMKLTIQFMLLVVRKSGGLLVYGM